MTDSRKIYNSIRALKRPDLIPKAGFTTKRHFWKWYNKNCAFPPPKAINFSALDDLAAMEAGTSFPINATKLRTQPPYEEDGVYKIHTDCECEWHTSYLGKKFNREKLTAPILKTVLKTAISCSKPVEGNYCQSAEKQCKFLNECDWHKSTYAREYYGQTVLELKPITDPKPKTNVDELLLKVLTEDEQPLPELIKDEDEQPLQVLIKDEDERPLQVLIKDEDELPLQVLIKDEDKQPLQVLIKDEDKQPLQVLIKDEDEQSLQVLIKDEDELPLQVLIKDEDEQPLRVLTKDHNTNNAQDQSEKHIDKKPSIQNIKAGFKVFMDELQLRNKENTSNLFEQNSQTRKTSDKFNWRIPNHNTDLQTVQEQKEFFDFLGLKKRESSTTSLSQLKDEEHQRQSDHDQVMPKIEPKIEGRKKHKKKKKKKKKKSKQNSP